MKRVYVLDACAMLSVLSGEPGGEKVAEFYQRAASGEITLVMHKLNLLEVYYDLYRAHGEHHAESFLSEIKRSPIVINREISDDIFAEAGRLKASYRVSLADSVALAQATVSGGVLLTSDHHEFDAIEARENVDILWIR